MTLLAYHNDPALKAEVLAQLHEHRCAVGCLTHDPEGGHDQYQTRWGIPAQLAWLEDAIFESLPAEEAKVWPGRFMDAIPVGADLSGVWPRFAIWLMVNPEWGLVNGTEAKAVKATCRQVAAGYEQIIAGGISDTDAKVITDAARAASAARDAWAASAARDAWAARDAFVAVSAAKLLELLAEASAVVTA